MADFPTLRAGSVAMYGTALGSAFKSEVVQFCDDSEQRWPVAQGVRSFVLELRYLDGYEMANVEEFFRSAKGRFDSTWSIAIDGSTWNNMTFEADSITWTWDTPLTQSATISCRQWRPN